MSAFRRVELKQAYLLHRSQVFEVYVCGERHDGRELVIIPDMGAMGDYTVVSTDEVFGTEHEARECHVRRLTRQLMVERTRLELAIEREGFTSDIIDADYRELAQAGD